MDTHLPEVWFASRDIRHHNQDREGRALNAQKKVEAAKQQKPGTINIHGKEYQTVALRVQMFREAHPDWSLTTSVMDRDAQCVVMQATIADTEGRVIATGHAEEYRTSSQINKTSALENAETSAIGRALAALGLGGTEFATANEVQNAIHQQGNPGEDARDPTIPGITKIRNNLNKLRRDGSKIDADEVGALEAFNELVSANADDLTKIKEAGHSLWTGMGEDFDGFRAWIKRRREELTPQEESASYQLLVSTLMECTTRPELDAWTQKNMALVDILCDEERRKFEQHYDEAEATILAAAPLGAG